MKITEMQDVFTEFIDEVIQENDDKEGEENVIFSQKAKELVKRIADYSRNTKIYNTSEAKREKFWNETKDATPTMIYNYILDSVVNAPTMFHANSSIILLMPRLDKLLNGTTEDNNKED